MNVLRVSAKSLLATVLLSPGALAAPAQVPLFLAQSTESMVMINLSNDHQLFYKAYDDWSDVNEDGHLDTTYNHAIDYYGYFDAYKCYSYDADTTRFEPQSLTSDKFCNNNNGDWSGNFLNWATMTRIDTVRKVLYGGARSVDTATDTVLERSYLPGDAHSFAKYYVNTVGQIAKLTPWNVSQITLCSTTYAADGHSETVSAPPLIRVAAGNFALWAANERHQCHWQNHSELENDIFNSPNPNTNNGNDPSITGLNASADNPDWETDKLGLGDYVVRVKACVSGLVGREECKSYPDGNLKPIGLLQEYGDEGDIHFGLITGSFARNKSGGTLRKNVGAISDEINIGTDGSFKAPPATGNIIGTLSMMRVSGYDHDPGYYNDSDGCSWGLNTFDNGSCTNWGNPQSEIYLESLRYFAGKSANFNANDTGFIPNLISAPSWSDPLDNTNYCAAVKIIQFNASVTSYDGDELAGASDLDSFGTVGTWTNQVGTGEGIAGKTFFIGEGSGTSETDGLCTAKTLDNLDDAKGLCPEAPRLEGGYDIAGLAYYAHTRSIRSDLVDVDGNQAEINIETYGVTLAPAVPKIVVPVPGTPNQVVNILPACRNESISGNCSIVDFKVVEAHAELAGSPGVYTGRFYVNWEDSEQGGDYDQDMAGVLSYEISAESITVKTRVFADSTSQILGFGYVISGTTQDGFHVHSGINLFTGFADPTNVLTCGDGTIVCETGEAETAVTYTLGASSVSLLEDPLYYAAKWGGFHEEPDVNRRPPDTNSPNGVPDQEYEWKNTATGLPSNYFFSRNPQQLSEQLATLFEAVDETTSASAVVANSVSFQSTTRIFQARFDSADWSGQLLSFPLDVTTGAVLNAEWDSGPIVTAQDYDSGREIMTWDPVAETGVAFRWDELDVSQQNLLDIYPGTVVDDDGGQDRLNYIRGDRSNELYNGGTFRSRGSLLGDNVNSSPAVVGAPDAGYVDVLESTAGSNEAPNNLYSDFVALYDDVDCFESDGVTVNASKEREPIVYFGANDGMLHGVSACTGREWLAYVPNTVMAELPQLTSPSYSHLYYVDGSPTVVDAFWSGAWHTALVGSLRGGGKGVFALDVTDPGNFAESYAANIVLWELNDVDLPDLGYTYSQPAIMKAKGDGWVAAFGNGYDSASGKAVLYLVNLASGSVSVTKVLDNGTGNGLSTIAPVDVDNDGEVDLIYAGDLKGNLWRITAGNNGFGNGSAEILYSAKSAGDVAQPITSRPEVGVHPLSTKGRMVYFATGKYFEQTDGDPLNAVQYNSVYGIWDRDAGGTITSVTTRNSDVLQQQTIDEQTVQSFDGNSHDIRVVSDTPISWVAQNANNNQWNACSASGSCGWYLDLINDGVRGEKVVANPILRGGRLIFVTTIPSLELCAAGGDSWLMEIDASNGGRIDYAVFDLNGDGVFDFDDMFTTTDDNGGTQYTPVSGKKSKVGILQPPAIVAGVGGAGTGGFGKAEAKYASGSKQGQIEVTVEHGGLPSAGRKSWIQFQ